MTKFAAELPTKLGQVNKMAAERHEASIFKHNFPSFPALIPLNLSPNLVDNTDKCTLKSRQGFLMLGLQNLPRILGSNLEFLF